MTKQDISGYLVGFTLYNNGYFEDPHFNQFFIAGTREDVRQRVIEVARKYNEFQKKSRTGWHIGKHPDKDLKIVLNDRGGDITLFEIIFKGYRMSLEKIAN